MEEALRKFEGVIKQADELHAENTALKQRVAQLEAAAAKKADESSISELSSSSSSPGGKKMRPSKKELTVSLTACLARLSDGEKVVNGLKLTPAEILKNLFACALLVLFRQLFAYHRGQGQVWIHLLPSLALPQRSCTLTCWESRTKRSTLSC